MSSEPSTRTYVLIGLSACLYGNWKYGERLIFERTLEGSLFESIVFYVIMFYLAIILLVSVFQLWEHWKVDQHITLNIVLTVLFWKALQPMAFLLVWWLAVWPLIDVGLILSDMLDMPVTAFAGNLVLWFSFIASFAIAYFSRRLFYKVASQVALKREAQHE